MENNQKEIILIEDLGYIKPKETSNYKKRYGIYRCFCGNEFKTQTQSIKSGNTKSCGCYNIEKIKEMATKHNMYYSSIYKVWASMIQRCANPKDKAYNNYGNRNITIHKEWKSDFLSFYTWALNNGYKQSLSIDRINNNLGYSPDNCRWVTKNIQARNTRKIMATNKSGYRGVYWKKENNKFQATISVNNKSIYLGLFDTALEAAKAYDNYIIDNNLEHTRNF